MRRPNTAKLFKNGSSQAVRLPVEFRFEGNEVYIMRNEKTGDVVLSAHPAVNIWEDFLELAHGVDASDDYMTDRPLNRISDKTGVFDQEK